jgi:hypothetical protein
MDSAIDNSPISVRRQPRQKAAPAPSTSPVVPLSSIVHGPDGTIIIEELDSPAIRRAKNIRRKAERLKLEARASAAGPKVDRDGDDGDDIGSELTSLSEPDSNGDRMDVVEDEVRREEVLPSSEGTQAAEKPEVSPGDDDGDGDSDDDVDADGEVDEGIENEEEARRAEEESIQAEAEVKAAVEAPEMDEEDTDVPPPDEPQATRSARPSRTLPKRTAKKAAPAAADVEPGAVILTDGKTLDGGTLSTFFELAVSNII